MPSAADYQAILADLDAMRERVAEALAATLAADHPEPALAEALECDAPLQRPDECPPEAELAHEVALVLDLRPDTVRWLCRRKGYGWRKPGYGRAWWCLRDEIEAYARAKRLI